MTAADPQAEYRRAVLDAARQAPPLPERFVTLWRMGRGDRRAA